MWPVLFFFLKNLLLCIIVTLSSFSGKFKYSLLNNYLSSRNYSQLRFNWTKEYTHTHTHTHTHTRYIYIYTYIYIYIYIYIYQGYLIKKTNYAIWGLSFHPRKNIFVIFLNMNSILKNTFCYQETTFYIPSTDTVFRNLRIEFLVLCPQWSSFHQRLWTSFHKEFFKITKKGTLEGPDLFRKEDVAAVPN